MATPSVILFVDKQPTLVPDAVSSHVALLEEDLERRVKHLESLTSEEAKNLYKASIESLKKRITDLKPSSPSDEQTAETAS